MSLSNQLLLGFVLLSAVHPAFVGVEIHDGENHHRVGPLIRIKSFWLWLLIVVADAGLLGVGVFLAMAR